MYWIEGLAANAFAKPVPLLDKEGDVLRLGQYWDYEGKRWTGMDKSAFRDDLGISAVPVDWDDDGDLDLLLGANEGGIYLRLNEGSATEPSFAGESIHITRLGGVPLRVPSGHAMPVVADWDGDGKWDILSSSDKGAVYWWRNTGTAKAPAFAPYETLIPNATRAAKGEPEPIAPGTRAQIHVTDFDGDGDLDLLLGDYRRVDKKYHGWVWLFRRKSQPSEEAP